MASNRINILIIDDDEDDFVLTSDLLARIQGYDYHTDWVDSIESAIPHITAGKHDLYLVDYHLGRDTGLDVLKILQKIEGAPPVILLTGLDDREVDLAAMRLGAADYLIKNDLSVVLLERSLRYALERTRLIREIDRSRRETEALFTLSSTLEQATKPQTVIHDAATLLMGLIGVDTFLLWEIRENCAVLTHVQAELTPELQEYQHMGQRRSSDPMWTAVDQRRPVYVGDIAGQDETAYPHPLGFKGIAYVPLSVGEKMYLVTYGCQARKIWSVGERRLLEAGSRSIGVALERQNSIDLLAMAARTDSLTGLGNRRAFDEALDAATNSAVRHGHPLTLVFFDLDGLKRVNDQEGHVRGDDLLRMFAEKMKAGFRREDMLYRFGGDEFSAILSHTGMAGFEGIHARIRTAIDEVRSVGFPDVDVSIGMVAFPEEETGIEQLLRTSDARMYQHKLRHQRQEVSTRGPDLA